MYPNLIRVAKNYVEKKTSYALLITGKWGTGKTHFFDHVLSKELATIESPTPPKTYKPIRISLFGLKSIADVQISIITSLYPLFKNKKLSPSIFIGKLILRGVASRLRLGDIDKYLKDAQKAATLSINIEHIVLCFDDVERAHSSFHMQEFIGYVNHLTDTLGMKVILIANENKIKKFKSLKEKTIGISIEFNPEFDDLAWKVLENRYNFEFKSFYKALTEHKSHINKWLPHFDGNLRHLQYAFDNLLDIYSRIVDNHNLDGLEFEWAITSTLSYSIEFRAGNISINNPKNLDNYKEEHEISIAQAFINDKEPKPSYKSEFKEKYHLSDFKFSNSIFQHCLGGAEFSIEDYVEEVNMYFRPDEINKERHVQVFHLLNYNNFHTLTPEKYIDLTKELIEFATQGCYPITETLIIFDFITRYDNPLGIDPENLCKTLIETVDEQVETGQYNSNLNLYPSSSYKTSPLAHLFDILSEHIKDSIIYLKDSQKTYHLAEISSLLSNDFDTLLSNLKNKELYQYCRHPLPQTLAFQFAEILVKSPLNTLRGFIELIDERKSLADLDESRFFDGVQIKLSQLLRMEGGGIHPVNRGVINFITTKLDRSKLNLTHH